MGFFSCKERKRTKTAGFMWHLFQNYYVLIWRMTCLKHQETAFSMGRWVRNSEKVCVSLWCLERELAHTFFTTQQPGRRGSLGSAGLWQQEYLLLSLGLWLRISSKQLLWVLNLVQSFQIYVGACHTSISQLLKASNQEQFHLLATRSFFMSC